MSRKRSWRTGTLAIAVVAVAGWAAGTGNAASFGGGLKWAWTTPAAGDLAPDSVQVDATPIVLSLNDDNGDGKVNERDVPDIVFPATVSSSGHCIDFGVIRAISGADGTPLFGVFDSEYWVNDCSPLAAGDIDADGLPEIVAVQGARLVAFENDGTFKWFSDPLPVENRLVWGAGPSIADLNHDGRPEIVVGASVFDGSGRLAFSKPCRGNPGTYSVVADLDLAGDAEIVCGFTAYRSNGDVYWDARPPGAGSGVAAVADFDGDTFPEVAVADAGSLYLLHHDGTLAWGPLVYSAGATSAGAPVVADLDGDGAPDIGVAGGASFVAIDTYGTPIWSAPIEDPTSATAAAGFDFDGDGRTEIVHADQDFLRVFDGGTGAVLFSAQSSSCTWTESPVVADVDGDGSAEIVVGRNDACDTAFPDHGIQVFGDAAWAGAPGIWNQHAYHVTNVEGDGTIPAQERNHWQVPGLNNFRVNAFPAATQSPPVAADLAVTTAEDTPVSFSLPASDRDGDPLTFTVLTPPLHGTLTGTAPDLTYAPAPDFYGDDSFTFQANDGQADSNVATVTIVVTAVNDPPVAVAEVVGGSDAACAGPAGAAVTLDASDSRDPDGDPITYLWLDEAGRVVGTTVVVGVTVPPGSHAFTLTVTDGRGGSSTTTVTVTVGDTEAPRIQLHMSPSVLWPPNGEMVRVFARITVSDNCDAHPKVILKKVTNSEDDGHHHCGRPWIEGAKLGTDDRRFYLRAEREIRGRGRVYTVTYVVVDDAGNEGSASVRVVVPLQRGHDHDDGRDDDRGRDHS